MENAEPALFYADASALVKLVREEPESETLENFLADASLISCELAVAEIPRAIRRTAADDQQTLSALLTQAGELLDTVSLIPLDPDLLLAAGALPEPHLRTLDAIHVAAAIGASPVEAFLSYDERQSAAARLAGLRTVSPAPPAATPNTEPA